MPNLRLLHLTLSIATLLLTTPVLAATNSPTTSNAPVHISADHFRFDQQKGLGDYSGKVIVTQGLLIIKGSKLTILAPNNGPIQHLTMQGAPAEFQDTTTNGKHVSGQAKTMDYSPANQQIILTGDARVAQNGGTFRAARIVYDIRHDLVDAGSPGQRIEATFTPAQPKGSSKP